MVFFFFLLFSISADKQKKKKRQLDPFDGSIFDDLKRTKKKRLPERTLYPTRSISPSKSPTPSPWPTASPARTALEIKRPVRPKDKNNQNFRNEIAEQLNKKTHSEVEELKIEEPSKDLEPAVVLPTRPEDEDYDEWDIIQPTRSPPATPVHTFTEEELKAQVIDDDDDDYDEGEEFNFLDSDEEPHSLIPKPLPTLEDIPVPRIEPEISFSDHEPDKQNEPSSTPIPPVNYYNRKPSDESVKRFNKTRTRANTTDVPEMSEEDIKKQFKFQDAALNDYIEKLNKPLPTKTPKKKRSRKKLEREANTKFRELFYIPTATKNNNPCHRSAMLVDGKCVCNYGLVGDGYSNCYFPVPTLISVTPETLSGTNPSTISCKFNKTDFIPQGAFCLIGRVVVGGRFTKEDELECEVKPGVGKKTVQISFDGINWCEEKMKISFEEKKKDTMKMWTTLFFSVTAGVLVIAASFFIRRKLLGCVRRRMKRSNEEQLKQAVRSQQKNNRIINRVKDAFTRPSNRQDESTPLINTQ